VEKRKKGEEKETTTRDARALELEKAPPSSSQGRVVRHCTASRLHGLEPPLHLHLIASTTMVSNSMTPFLLTIVLAPCPPLHSCLEKGATVIAFAFFGSRT
jgi:hypothetical protein